MHGNWEGGKVEGVRWERVSPFLFREVFVCTCKNGVLVALRVGQQRAKYPRYLRLLFSSFWVTGQRGSEQERRRKKEESKAQEREETQKTKKRIEKRRGDSQIDKTASCSTWYLRLPATDIKIRNEPTRQRPFRRQAARYKETRNEAFTAFLPLAMCPPVCAP